MWSGWLLCLRSFHSNYFRLNHVLFHCSKLYCSCYCCQCFTENSLSEHLNRNCFSETEFETIIFKLRQVASQNSDWDVGAEGGGAIRLQLWAHRGHVGLEIENIVFFSGLDFQRGMQICKLGQNWDSTYLKLRRGKVNQALEGLTLADCMLDLSQVKKMFQNCCEWTLNQSLTAACPKVCSRPEIFFW